MAKWTFGKPGKIPSYSFGVEFFSLRMQSTKLGVMVTYIRDNDTTRNIEIAFVNQLSIKVAESLYTRVGFLMLVGI